MSSGWTTDKFQKTICKQSCHLADGLLAVCSFDVNPVTWEDTVTNGSSRHSAVGMSHYGSTTRNKKKDEEAILTTHATSAVSLLLNDWTSQPQQTLHESVSPRHKTSMVPETLMTMMMTSLSVNEQFPFPNILLLISSSVLFFVLSGSVTEISIYKRDLRTKGNLILSTQIQPDCLKKMSDVGPSAVHRITEIYCKC